MVLSLECSHGWTAPFAGGNMKGLRFSRGVRMASSALKSLLVMSTPMKSLQWRQCFPYLPLASIPLDAPHQTLALLSSTCNTRYNLLRASACPLVTSTETGLILDYT